MMKRQFLLCLFSGLSAMTLSGCVVQDQPVKEWMDEQSAKMSGKVDALPPVVQFVPIAFAGADGSDPFAPKISEIQSSKGSSGEKIPDMNRKKEFLEGFPLDNLKLVGIIKRFNVNWALIKSPDGNVNMVRAGNYLGTNYGKIVSVSADGLMLKESVQNGQGEWSEREMPVELKDQ